MGPPPVQANQTRPDAFDDVPAELENIVSELGALENPNADAKAFVYKVRDGESKQVYCFECAPGEISLEKIRANYGGGKYHIYFYFTRADGKRPLFAKSIKEILPPLPGSIAATQIASATSAPGDAKLDKLIELLSNPQTRENGNIGASIREWLPLIPVIKEIFAPQKQPGIMEMLEGMKSIKALAGEMTEGEAPKSDMAMLTETATKFLPFITGNQNVAPPPVEVAQNPRALPASQAQTVEQQNQEQEFEMFKLYLMMLAREALKDSKNPDAEARADNISLQRDWILGKIPDDAIDDFEAMIRADDWFSVLSTVQPSIATQRDWFVNLRSSIIEEFDAQALDAGLTPPGKNDTKSAEKLS